MTVKAKLVDGTFDIFTTEKYTVSILENMHPAILEVEVFADSGKRLMKLKRKHQKHYIKYEYKPLPPEENQKEEKI